MYYYAISITGDSIADCHNTISSIIPFTQEQQVSTERLTVT